MNGFDRQSFWDGVYKSKSETEVSWFEETPALSLNLLRQAGLKPGMAFVDVGGGASRLVNELDKIEHLDVTVLDVSATALEKAKSAMPDPSRVEWVVSDVTTWSPDRRYDLWHDRAVFHFLTAAEDQQAYIRVMSAALNDGGKAIIGTFAVDGPEKCSGLPTVRYDAVGLSSVLGDRFKLISTCQHRHTTPWNTVQSFQFSTFEKLT